MLEMTLNDLTAIATYEEFDRAFETESRRVSQGFIRMGYLLRMARDTDILYNSGYKTIAEYAEKKYGFKPDYVSNLIKVNEKYSEGGYSDRIQERYNKWGFSLLVELADLPEAIAEEIPDGIKREEIREIKREVKKEEQITPIEAMLEEEKPVTRTWSTIPEKFFVQYYHSHPDEFKEARAAWIQGVRDYIRDEKPQGKTLMEILAPSGICAKMARIQGVGKYMLTIRDSDNPPVLVNVRSAEKIKMEWQGWIDTIDRILDDPEDESYQEAWRALYGEAFPGEEQDEKEDAKKEAEPVVSGSATKGRPEAKTESPTLVPKPAPDPVEEDRGADNKDEQADGGIDKSEPKKKSETKTEEQETGEIAPAQIMNPPEEQDDSEEEKVAHQSTVEDFPEVLPEGYVPTAEQKPDEITALWDRARALVNAMHRWMDENVYGIGPKTKEGLDDILNASLELQKVVRKLKEQL